jgi:hypothetical protein
MKMPARAFVRCDGTRSQFFSWQKRQTLHTHLALSQEMMIAATPKTYSTTWRGGDDTQGGGEIYDASLSEI